MRGTLSIAAKTKKLDVDSRLSLKYYYRTADNLLKQVPDRIAGFWMSTVIVLRFLLGVRAFMLVLKGPAVFRLIEDLFSWFVGSNLPR